MGRGRRSRWGTTPLGEIRRFGRWCTVRYGRTSHWPACTMSMNSARMNSLWGPLLAVASRWAPVHWADERLAGAPVDRRVERMEAAVCGSNVVSARQDWPRCQAHNPTKDMPDSNNKADNSAELPRLSGRSRYGLAPVGDVDAIAGTAAVPLAVAASGPSAGPGL
jgi:hypothetical protein